MPWHILAPAALLSACDARLATTEVERRPLATSSLYAAVRILPEAFYIIGNAISYYIKKALLSEVLLNVGERIRTPGLLVRSQTLYPAELNAHPCEVLISCPSQQ